MTRSKQLIERPRRTLAALGLGLCAVGVAVGSGADFSARTANPSNTFSAGALTMDNSRNNAAILNATNLRPGGPQQTGVVDIKNTGSIDGVFKLSRDLVTSSDHDASNPTPFATKVNVRIVDCGTFSAAGGAAPAPPACGDADDSTLYDGTLAAETAALALGTYRAGEQHRYQFGGSLDASAGNEYTTDDSSARYLFDAVQAP